MSVDAKWPIRDLRETIRYAVASPASNALFPAQSIAFFESLLRGFSYGTRLDDD